MDLNYRRVLQTFTRIEPGMTAQQIGAFYALEQAPIHCTALHCDAMMALRTLASFHHEQTGHHSLGNWQECRDVPASGNRDSRCEQ